MRVLLIGFMDGTRLVTIVDRDGHSEIFLENVNKTLLIATIKLSLQDRKNGLIPGINENIELTGRFQKNCIIVKIFDM